VFAKRVAEARVSRFTPSVEVLLDNNNVSSSPSNPPSPLLSEDVARLRVDIGPLRSRPSASSKHHRTEVARYPSTKSNDKALMHESLLSDVVSDIHLRVYQVLSPVLEDRGPYFGAHLALKEEWLEVDSPYYEAPG
jgi:hypothetical protein